MIFLEKTKKVVKDSIKMSIENIRMKRFKYLFLKTKKRDMQRILLQLEPKRKLLNSEFKEGVLKKWDRFGERPQKFWYDLWYEKDGNLDYRYITEYIWLMKVVPYYNKASFRYAYADKNMQDIYFPQIKQPTIIVKNMNGVFYNKENELITYQDAIEITEQYDEFIIKPSIESGRGTGVAFYKKSKDEKLDIKEIFSAKGKDYIVQQIVQQHEALASIHPNSLNTIRILTFVYEGDFNILASYLRMGTAGKRIDNINQGGLKIQIQEDGSLSEFAINGQFKRFYQHPQGSSFKGVKIPNYDRVIETVKKAHFQLPYFKIVGWDIAIDTDGNPVLVEYNIGGPAVEQYFGGPIFGDLTEKVLQDVFSKKLPKTR